MIKDQKINITYRIISALLLLLCTIAGHWLYQQPPLQQSLKGKQRRARIVEPLISRFNNAYARRTNYDDLRLSAYPEDYYATLSINPELIGYGSGGQHSLSQMVHTLKALAKDRHNKGLFIILETKEQVAEHDDTIGPCLTLAEAIDGYKQQTGRTVIAFGETFMPKSYCIATVADKIYMGASGTLTLPAGAVHSAYGLQELHNQPLNNNAKLDVHKYGNQLVCGKYKKILSQDDIEDNFKKCYQDPYIQRVQARKNAIKKQKNGGQNPVSNVVENFIKDGSFQRIPYFIEGITARKAYDMELVDGYKQKQKVISEQSYPMQPCDTSLPNRTWKENIDLIQQPAIEVVFIKGQIDQSLEERITPLFNLFAKNNQVKGIILVIDSRGGYAGCNEAIIKMVRTLKEAGKTIYTYTEGYCCSAAYAIGCTADKVFARETAYIGSIGGRKRLGAYDDGPFWLTMEHLYKYFLKSYTQHFIHLVASCRAKRFNTSKEDFVKKVLSTEARVFNASKALKIGLIDTIGTLETTIAAMKKALKDPNIKVFYREHPLQANALA